MKKQSEITPIGSHKNLKAEKGPLVDSSFYDAKLFLVSTQHKKTNKQTKPNIFQWYFHFLRWNGGKKAIVCHPVVGHGLGW